MVEGQHCGGRGCKMKGKNYLLFFRSKMSMRFIPLGSVEGSQAGLWGGAKLFPGTRFRPK